MLQLVDDDCGDGGAIFVEGALGDGDPARSPVILREVAGRQRGDDQVDGERLDERWIGVAIAIRKLVQTLKRLGQTLIPDWAIWLTRGGWSDWAER